MNKAFSKSSIVTTILDRGIGQYITGSVVFRKCVTYKDTYYADCVIDDELGNVYKCRKCGLLSETTWQPVSKIANLSPIQYKDPVFKMPKVTNSLFRDEKL